MNLVVGNNNKIPNGVSAALINCEDMTLADEDNGKAIFSNGAFVIDENGIATGTIKITSATKTADFVAGIDAFNVYYVDATSGNITVTLEVGNIPIWFVKTDVSANTVILTPSSGLINGAATFTLTTQFQKVHTLCNGTDFYV